ncbi:unnamed protein product [Paramecium sonneborni]|uniref:Uncharacterized protein n=1 Tax=Paramecium sonneborni TaxID=65129 RepID=A0A8S1RCX9_9CILI|nr:unnamed protein product [Paramecium sonneborni]
MLDIIDEIQENFQSAKSKFEYLEENKNLKYDQDNEEKQDYDQIQKINDLKDKIADSKEQEKRKKEKASIQLYLKILQINFSKNFTFLNLLQFYDYILLMLLPKLDFYLYPPCRFTIEKHLALHIQIDNIYTFYHHILQSCPFSNLNSIQVLQYSIIFILY